MNPRKSYDFYLVLATALVLFIISIICIYGMFYFKLAQIHQVPLEMKISYMERMNSVIAPFLVCLIILLGICVPKRLLSTRWLNRFAFLLLGGVVFLSMRFDVGMGLLFTLVVAFFLQTIVLVLAVAGRRGLNFQKKGYWQRVGSSFVHLALILFVLDLFLGGKQTLHLFLFWITLIVLVLGMIFCFYSQSIAGLFQKKAGP